MMLVPTSVSAHCKGKHTGDHEHCVGGGGEDPPDDACLTSSTFPTLAFWGLSGQVHSAGLFLSDATGACVQQVTPNGGPCLLGEMKMHYEPPPPTGGVGTGRVVSYCFDDAFLTDFSVAPDNSVTVSNDNILVASVTGSGGIGDVDIASDGDSLAFSYHWADENSDGWPDGESLYIVSADDCLMSSPWLDTNPSACNAQEILSIENMNFGDGGVRWTGLSWNHDRTRIYLHQSKHTEVSGLYVAEEDDNTGVWNYSLLASGETLGGGTLFPAATFADWDGPDLNSRGDREVLAFRFSTDAPCAEIHIIDVEDCRGDTTKCGNIGPDLVGRTPSFTNDGQLVFNLLKRKGKHTCNNQNKITIMDPFTPGSAPTEILNGTDPDG